MKHFVYLVGLHIYYMMIHGPYNIKLNAHKFTATSLYTYNVFLHVPTNHVAIFRDIKCKG